MPIERRLSGPGLEKLDGRRVRGRLAGRRRGRRAAWGRAAAVGSGGALMPRECRLSGPGSRNSTLVEYGAVSREAPGSPAAWGRAAAVGGRRAMSQCRLAPRSRSPRVARRASASCRAVRRARRVRGRARPRLPRCVPRRAARAARVALAAAGSPRASRAPRRASRRPRRRAARRAPRASPRSLSAPPPSTRRRGSGSVGPPRQHSSRAMLPRLESLVKTSAARPDRSDLPVLIAGGRGVQVLRAGRCTGVVQTCGRGAVIPERRRRRR